jgi:hypothetical protein
MSVVTSTGPCCVAPGSNDQRFAAAAASSSRPSHDGLATPNFRTEPSTAIVAANTTVPSSSAVWASSEYCGADFTISFGLLM